jgi:hypothetical protein
MKKGKKILFIFSLIFGVIILLILFSAIASALKPIAVLTIGKGTVQVDSGNGWSDAKDGMALKEGYSVKTLADSRAIILFRESSVMRMDENTEITISNLNSSSVSIYQKIGQTWNRLLKLSGISNYEVKTPEAVASVRGTVFSISSKNETDVDVLEGIVKINSYKMKDNRQEILASLDLENASLSIFEDKLDKLEKKILTKTEWINENDAADKEHLKLVKAKLLKKYSFQIKLAKIAAGIKDEDIEKYADDIVEGRLSIKKSIEDGNIPKILLPFIPAELKRA